VPEGQRLEFKRKSNPDRPDLNADDRKNLGESLSAFSNAEDGVVLWGIMDERGADGLDYAKEPQPLVDPQLIAGKFASLVAEYLSPPNP
jgi:predicted HTH transcriptional regulator